MINASNQQSSRTDLSLPAWVVQLPVITHSTEQFSLLDAVRIAVANRALIGEPAPNDLLEVRHVIEDMQRTAGHAWRTGEVALQIVNNGIQALGVAR
ncbi:hypothetical protein [Stutzerimonas stutzeri]|uniref:hypothetical protein n=1 Tax=Stutzerimonas stutzeri TaxID=316 RepID=UPI001E78C980|nr:hypothetical protein [Stutzerimonas stutzeri]CAB5555912.1 Uncharacterised protein [Stutzerimonas stutzeri]CAB5597526.1 Uncharacterised protein [Stutzerimonas stutzeri]CAC9158468.1 Uncharacterised protein [Stutzerimonas stutzeri]CAD0188289.1 Hypothetical_protein [Stutzerimonas stutzeri]